MKNMLKTVLMATGILFCGIAFGTSYEIGKDDPQCEYLTAALKKVRIENMTGAQLCQIQQKKIKQWLKAGHIHDLAWEPFPTTDPAQLMRVMVESTISEKDLPKFAKSISSSLELMKMLAENNNYFYMTAPLNFSGRDIYVLQLNQKRCPNVNGGSDTDIGNGLFLDKELKSGVGDSLLMPGGVINFFGGPATLVISAHSLDLRHPKGIDVQLSPIIWDPKKAAGAGTVVKCRNFIPSDVSMHSDITHG